MTKFDYKVKLVWLSLLYEKQRELIWSEASQQWQETLNVSFLFGVCRKEIQLFIVIYVTVVFISGEWFPQYLLLYFLSQHNERSTCIVVALLQRENKSYELLPFSVWLYNNLSESNLAGLPRVLILIETHIYFHFWYFLNIPVKGDSTFHVCFGKSCDSCMQDILF